MLVAVQATYENVMLCKSVVGRFTPLIVSVVPDNEKLVIEEVWAK